MALAKSKQHGVLGSKSQNPPAGASEFSSEEGGSWGGGDDI